MEQQQIVEQATDPVVEGKVSYSLGTRLLISVVTLLIVAISFLNISAILLLKEDKRAYIYQSQATESVLVGRDFVNTAGQALASLRLFLATIDFTHPITPDQVAFLKNGINNQSRIIHASIVLLDQLTLKTTELANANRDDEIGRLQLVPPDFEISADWWKFILPELLKNSYMFVNLSKPGTEPLLGLMVADTKASGPNGLPVAIGVLSLAEFSKQLAGMNLTIATKSGWVLYDTDPSVLYSKKNISDDPLFDSSSTSRFASGANEFKTSSGHFLGSFVHPGLDLVVLTKLSWQKAMKATYALTENLILLGLMGVGAAVIFAIFFSRSLTAPINRLYEATKQVAKGNFQMNLPAGNNDEIGALTSSFNVMSRKINGLIQESMQKVKLENELAIAATVQQTLIPPSSFKNDDIAISSYYQSAAHCGGDWWGFFTSGRKVCLMIADATGHGFPSALMTAAARSYFSVMQQLAASDPEFSFSPSAMLSVAHRVIFDASAGRIMMTFFVGVLDLDKNTLTYASAGHNPQWLFKKTGEAFSLNSLFASGLRLGDTSEETAFEEKSIDIAPGDALFLYTDGVMEGKNQAGDMFGKKRVRKIIEGKLKEGPESAVKGVVSDFLSFNSGKLDDDVTLAIVQILPHGKV